MATTVTFNGLNYSVPAVNEEDWQSLSDYLVALAGAAPAGGPVSSNIRISTSATTAVATTDYAVLINVAAPATVNLPAGVDKQIFVIADASGAAATNNITINRAGANTILGGTSLVLDRNNEVVILGFSGGNWYRLGDALPNALSSPVSTTTNGLVAYAGTDGKQAIDLGVGSANQILKTDGTTPSFGLIVNDNVDAAAAIAYSKLNLAGSIVNADINSSAAIQYSKLTLTNSIVNADINSSAAIAYSKLNLANSIQNTDVAVAANIAYSKLDLAGAIVNNDISATAAVAYSKLDLADSIVNADINSSAAIAYSKLDLGGSIVDADINASAAIARSKIASGSASHVVVNDGAGALSSVATLPVSQGGTGLSALGSALQLLRVNASATGLEFATLSGLGDVSGPSSSVTNGIVQFASTTGKAIKDLGVGSANQVLLTDGTAPSFGAVTNAYIDVNAGISFSKLASLTDSYLLVGSATNVPTAVAVTGDVTISNTGVTAISSNSIVNSDISPSAGIALTKLNSVTSNRALESNGAGNIQASSVTSTELGYLSGVTSAIQTQIDSKTGIADNETITGTWIFNNLITGSISGNAGTVTNGAYVNAANTFTLAQTISAASNQLVLSSGVNQLTFNSGTSAAARTYTVPDVGASANFVMDAGAQTIGGAKTFSDNTVFNSNVSIGTTATPNIFTVQSGADFEGFQFNDQDGNRLARLIQNDDSGTNCVTFDMFASGGSSTIVNRISSRPGLATYFNAGNVGIGTSSPSSLLTARKDYVFYGRNVALELRDDAGTVGSSYLATVEEDFYLSNGAYYLGANDWQLERGKTGFSALIMRPSGAISFRQSSGNTADSIVDTLDTQDPLSISSTGAVTLGPVATTPTLTHLAYCGTFKIGGNAGTNTQLHLAQNNPVWFQQVMYDSLTTRQGLDINTYFGGNVLAGRVSPTGAWTLGPSGANSSIQHTARGRFDTYSNTATTTDGLFTCSSNVGGAGLIKFRVDADGDVTAAGTISDLRAKKLVRNIPYGLNELLQLDPSGFRWNHEEDNAVEWFTPASAQKLQEIMPEMVREDGLGMTDENGQAFVAKAIYKDEILAVTVKAIQELNAKVEALEKE